MGHMFLKFRLKSMAQVRLTHRSLDALPLHHGRRDEGDEGDEGHEGHEGQEDLCEARKAPRLRRQGHEDCHWAVEGRPDEEQGGQDCEQEEECRGEAQPVARRREGRARGVEDQGVLAHQEGLGFVQEGKGTLQEVSAKGATPIWYRDRQARGYSWSTDGPRRVYVSGRK